MFNFKPSLLAAFAVAAVARASTFGNSTDVGFNDVESIIEGTDVIDSLNKQIVSGAVGGKGMYKGGKGIFVQTPDFFSGGNQLVVPVSFWVNDIMAPNTLYPGGKQVGQNPAAGNPWCPHDKMDGFQNIEWSKCDLNDGPWSYATVAAVIGEGGMKQVYSGTFDQIQDEHWGWGVFYAYDANAADKRCRNLGSQNGFDCPGTWITYQGASTPDSSKKGAGFYKPGNPYSPGGGGGGAGCHWDYGTKNIDQTDAWSGQDNLVEDLDCQCNYNFKSNWDKWVDDWIANTKQKSGFEWRAWLKGGGGRAPAWGLDTAICWVNNPRDMILLQNALWEKHESWLNGQAPQWSTKAPQPYWGWNEVPADRGIVNDPKWWDAVMIKLPADMENVKGLQWAQQTQLEQDLATWEHQGKIIPGSAHCSSRPGSYIVFAREMKWKKTKPYGYYREFYCENWSSPRGWYKTVYTGSSGGSKSACYIDRSKSDVVV